MLRSLNFQVYDSDKVAHQLIGPGGCAVEKTLSLFGAELGNLDSGINRSI